VRVAKFSGVPSRHPLQLLRVCRVQHSSPSQIFPWDLRYTSPTHGVARGHIIGKPLPAIALNSTDRQQYRALLRQSNRFAAYNFREYSKRRTRDMFREHRGERDEAKAKELLAKARKDLEVLKVCREVLHLLPANVDPEASHHQPVLPERKARGREDGKHKCRAVASLTWAFLRRRIMYNTRATARDVYIYDMGICDG
jgi:hypothetical protein